MFDHVGIAASDYAKSKAFYEAVLAPLNMKPLFDIPDTVTGFGVDRPIFWVSASDAEHPVSARVHVAFQAANEEAVKAFHVAALAAGGKDNGAPGLRPEYHEKYYGAFILDLDGNNIEAVFGNG